MKLRDDEIEIEHYSKLDEILAEPSEEISLEDFKRELESLKSN